MDWVKIEDALPKQGELVVVKYPAGLDYETGWVYNVTPHSFLIYRDKEGRGNFISSHHAQYWLALDEPK